MQMFLSLMEAVVMAFTVGAIVGAVVALHLRGVKDAQAVDAASTKEDINGA